MTTIEVVCDPIGSEWECSVRVADDAGATGHEVTVSAADLPRLVPTPDFDDIERLVRETFGFLLEREPKESILPRFDLAVVGRYFPEYEREIRLRLLR